MPEICMLEIRTDNSLDFRQILMSETGRTLLSEIWAHSNAIKPFVVRISDTV